MTALALRDDQTQWDANQLAVLRANGIDEDVTDAELMAFLHECQRRKLDPFSKQIYLIGRKDKSKGRKVYRSQTSIDGFRLIARRAADRSGIDYSYDDTIWYSADGSRHEIWLADRPPAGAKVVVIRNGSRYDAVARYGAYVQTDYNDNPLKQWRTMPDVMIAKCAEALALRKAFPEDLGGIYTEEEMAQADNPQRVTATAEVIRDEPARQNGHDQNGGSQPDHGQPWADQATELAASLKSEQAAGKLWRETAARLRRAEITDEDAGKIGDLIEARVADLRRQVYDQAMSLLSQDEPWRDKILELADEDEARAALEELGQLMEARTIDAKRGNRISHAIVARFPRATDADREAVA